MRRATVLGLWIGLAALARAESLLLVPLVVFPRLAPAAKAREDVAQAPRGAGLGPLVAAGSSHSERAAEGRLGLLRPFDLVNRLLVQPLRPFSSWFC